MIHRVVSPLAALQGPRFTAESEQDKAADTLKGGFVKMAHRKCQLRPGARARTQEAVLGIWDVMECDLTFFTA